jgi:chromosome segregation ATPase
MRVSEHERIVDERDNDAYASWNKAITDRDKFRDQVRDTCARAEKAERHVKMADNQTDAAIRSRDEWEAKFKLAATDLAAQTGQIAKLTAENARLVSDYGVRGDILSAKSSEVRALDTEIATLRHDAQKWRDKLARDRAARKGVGK